MPKRVSLSEGLGADETVVLGMRTDPEPMDAITAWQPESAVVESYSGAVHLAAAKQLELDRRVGRVRLEQLEVLVSERAYL